jgi:F0F1-type ATP synthase membrane subunit b/b'
MAGEEDNESAEVEQNNAENSNEESQIEQANKAAERLEKANEEMKKLVEKNERILIDAKLQGRSLVGQKQKTEEEVFNEKVKKEADEIVKAFN